MLVPIAEDVIDSDVWEAHDCKNAKFNTLFSKEAPILCL